MNVILFYDEQDRLRMRQAKLMIKVVSRMANAKTSIALRAWIESIAHFRHCEALMTKVVKRMVKSVLYKGLFWQFGTERAEIRSVRNA